MDDDHKPAECAKDSNLALADIQRRLAKANAERDALEGLVDELRDSNCDKIMAMTEDQINALTRMDGSNPDDVARLGRQAIDLAVLATKNEKQQARIAELEAQVDALKVDAERYRWLREGCDHKGGEANRIVTREYGGDWDAAIDAAMKESGQ